MLSSGIKPSSVIVRTTKYGKILQYNALMIPMQGGAKMWRNVQLSLTLKTQYSDAII